jgi:hypothetical protein
MSDESQEVQEPEPMSAATPPGQPAGPRAMPGPPQMSAPPQMTAAERVRIAARRRGESDYVFSYWSAGTAILRSSCSLVISPRNRFNA